MPSTWETVRVFISSTFRDMHSERDHLVKVVFPALRERLEKYRIHLVDIDLRWGVTAEQVDNDQALELCLQQINVCRPLFIGILGERYGWVPKKFPTMTKPKYRWIQSEYSWNQEEQKEKGKSITELEIIYGVLNDHEKRSRAFFYFRDNSFMKDVPLAKRDEMLSEDVEAGKNLEALKQVIRNSDLPLFDGYPCRYRGLRINWRLARTALNKVDQRALHKIARDGIIDPQEYRGLHTDLRNFVDRHAGVYLDELNDFGKHVHDQLWQAIKAEFNLQVTSPTEALAQSDPLDEEANYHERFMESRLRVYVGRNAVNCDLTRFANSDATAPCLVTGASGAGKTAALVKFARDYSENYSGTLVIPHFAGVSPTSTSLREMLRRFCLMLQEWLGDVADVPQEVRPLEALFRRLIADVPEDRQVVFVIDALNHLDSAENAQHLHWLPRKLSPHVKMIASCIDDAGRTEEVLEAFEHREHSIIRIGPLTDNERIQIIHEVPSISAKTLSADQIRLLLDNPTTKNPLFLLVALEELRGFAPFEQLDKRISAFPRKGKKLISLFSQVIQRLETEFDEQLVRDVLQLLAVSHRGLSEQELRELTVPGKDSTELFAILRQLRPHLSVSNGLIYFYHRGLFEAIHGRYFLTARNEHAIQSRLADYRWEQFHGRTSASTPYITDDLPTHLVDAQQWERLKQIVLDGKVNYLSRWTEGGRTAQGRLCLTALLEHAKLPRVDGAGLATQLAQICMTHADYEEAQRWLNQAIQATSWFRERRVRAIALHELASLCLYQEEFSEAARLYEKALKLCLRGWNKHYDEAGANLIGIATVHHALLEFDEAINRASAALEYSEKAHDYRHQIAARRLMAVAYLSLGELEEVEYQLSAATLLSEVGHTAIEKPRLLFLKGRIRYVRATLERVQPREAIPFYRDSLAEAKNMHDLYGQVEALMSLGWAAFVCRETSEAVGLFQRAGALLPPRSRPELHAWLRLAKAAHAHQTRKLQASEELYVSVSEQCVRDDLPYWRVKALVGAGSAQWHLGQNERARETWKMACEIAENVSKHIRKLAEISIELCRTDPRVTPR